MRVLLAALCFTATEPPGFGSTERMMCVSAPSLSLFYRQHINLVGGKSGGITDACKNAYSVGIYTVYGVPMTRGLFMNVKFCFVLCFYVSMEDCMQNRAAKN